MEKQYGATDDADAARAPVEQPKKQSRGRKDIAAIALTSTLLLGVNTQTGKRELTRLRRTVTNSPVTVAEVYDILVTQALDLTVYCNAAKPGTQPYALCGLTTCMGVEEYDYLGACKCVPETIDEIYTATDDAAVSAPITATFVMGYTSVFLARSETFREAVMSQYLGTLDDAGVQNLCTALTDGSICDESGLGCDFVSFHTGAENGVCGDDDWTMPTEARGKSPGKKGVRGGPGPLHPHLKGVQSRHLTTKGWGADPTDGDEPVVDVCMGAPCWQLAGDDDGCSLTCLCPISVPGVAATFLDDVVQTDFTDSCFLQQAVSTAWNPTLDEVNILIDGLAEAGSDVAQKASECDCTVSTTC
jgi:hypothetical protein